MLKAFFLIGNMTGIYLIVIGAYSYVNEITIKSTIHIINGKLVRFFKDVFGSRPVVSPSTPPDFFMAQCLTMALAPFNELPSEHTAYQAGINPTSNLPCIRIELIPKVGADRSVIRRVLENTFYEYMANAGIPEVDASIRFEKVPDSKYHVIILYAVQAWERERLQKIRETIKQRAIQVAKKSTTPPVDKDLGRDFHALSHLNHPGTAPGMNPAVIIPVGHDMERAFAPIQIDIGKTGHFCIVGETGSGKSVFTLYCLYRLFKTKVPLRLFIGDFKKSGDYAGITDRYKDFEAVPDLIDEFYQEFEATPEGSDQLRVLVLDEYAGLITWLGQMDKKRCEDIRAKVANLLMLGRSRRCFVWCVQQRISASLFPSGIGAIDNFQVCIGLGRLSTESRKSLFAGEHFEKEEFEASFHPGTGQGFCLVSGSPLRALCIPYIEDKKKLIAVLRALAK